MVTTAAGTIVDGAVCCCAIHTNEPLVAIRNDPDLVSWGIRVLYYCPIPNCKIFRSGDGTKTWDKLYARFDIHTLEYVIPTREQRALQYFLRHIFILTVRVKILEDKEKRRL